MRRMSPSQDVAQADWGTGTADVIDLDDLGGATGPDVAGSSSWHAFNSADELLTKPEYLTKAQAGEIVQLHPKTIERAIQNGELRAFKLRQKVRISRSDLEAWVKANEIEPHPSIHDI